MVLTQDQKKALTVESVIGVVCILLIVYMWFMIGKPKVEANALTMKTVKDNIATKKGELAKVNQFEAQSNKDWEKIQLELEKIASRLPSTIAAPQFYNDLRKSLMITGIDTTQLSGDDVKAYREYSEIPYSVEAKGRYHDFGQFINLVEENQRFMRIKSFNIESNKDRPSLHPVNVGIATYKLEN